MKKDKDSYINIKLENFNFFHRATTKDNEDPKYIHRDKPELKLRNWLLNPNRHGTYLVSGYRGVGKSSLVGSVIGQLKKDCKYKYLSVSINIGQENINELNILQIIAKNLREELVRSIAIKKHGFNWYNIAYILNNHAYHILFMGILSAILIYLQLRFGTQDQTTDDYMGYSARLFALVSYLLFWISLGCGILYLLQTALRQCFNTFRAIDKLEKLCVRFNSKTIYRRSAKSGLDQFPIGSIAKEMEQQAANIQEIEYELTEILSSYTKRRVIIVLDELDKTDPMLSHVPEKEKIPDYEKVSIRPEQHTTSRSRRIQVLNVIANMKFFLSTANAYFIFIAGRELYEASMADMSDRDFSISNIFNGIINIDSFYSHPNIHDSIAYTEEFVCRQIMPQPHIEFLYRRTDKHRIITLRDYRDYRICYNGPKDNARLDKEIVFLYHFISYLAFISNGSPKKITSFFEKYIHTYKFIKDDGRIDPKAAESGDSEYWLSFGYNNQMKINFIHYITYPVIQNIMSKSSTLGDKLQVSDSFLLAHIFKMHQGGFSWRNLEHSPEILEINRLPEIRDNINSLIKYLNHTSLTTISCGLYQYKFPLRFSEEISYFSKMSDEFSALFNFSLDELQSTKNFYFRTIEHHHNKPVKSNIDLYAEASIQHSLGDVYMQEENYSAAIRNFEKCIEIVSPLLKEHNARYEQFQNYVLFYNRTMLKLGLAHEKRHTDNSAYAIYTDLVEHLITIRRKNPQANSLFRDNRTMHLGILARLNVLEKLDTTGICPIHIDEAVNDFKAIFGSNLFSDETGLGSKNINKIVWADFYRKLGDILYYKNTDFNNKSYDTNKLYYTSITILLSDEKTETFNMETFLKEIIKIISDSENEPSRDTDSVIYNLAILCESIGHTLLQSIMTIYDYQNIESYYHELKNIAGYIIDDFSQAKWPIKKIHKTMMCYWAASKLYGASCERDLAGRCYKQLMQLINLYTSAVTSALGNDTKNYDMSLSLIQHLSQITDFLSRRFIMSQYRQYEHINFSEITQVGRMLRISDPSLLANHLSLYPSIDEMQCIYSTFTMLSHQLYSKAGKTNPDIDAWLTAFVHKDLKNEDIYHCTLSNTIIRYHTVSKIYKYFLLQLLDPYIDHKKMSDTDPDSAIIDYLYSPSGVTTIKRYLTGNGQIPHFIRYGMNPAVDISQDNYRFRLIKEILARSIKYSSRIIQIISPFQSITMFNHSFRGNVYINLAIFQIMMNQLCEYCGYDPILDNDLHETYCTTPDNANKYENYMALKELFNHEYMLRHDRLSNVNYLVENAIHSYTKARLCSSQGTSYQELIRNIYFLDDDLNNDTIQFSIASERASKERIYKREMKLKQLRAFNNTSVYKIGNYIRPEEQVRII